MIPDLRFVIGAVIATALLGVTFFGLAAAIHISHQSKVGPLEGSRLLAYTPDGRHRIFDSPPPRFDSPFANIPADPNPVPLQQPAAPASPLQTAATVQPTPEAQPATVPQPADDADAVDERAVVDPPLPPDNDPPAAVAESVPAAPAPEPPVAAVAPIETTPAAPEPIAETPAEPAATPDVQQVGSIPVAPDAAETRSDATEIAEAQEPEKAKRRRTARKAARAKRLVYRTPAQIDPFASTGYPVSASAVSTANRPAQGFWTID